MNDLDAHRFCYITTRGRVTGDPHTIEIWFAARDRTLFILAGGGERSDTVKNVRADPEVAIRIGDATYEATGRVVDDPEEARLARALIPKKYAHEEDGLVEWAEAALPMAFDVVTTDGG